MLLTPWVSQPDESAAASFDLAPSALWVGGIRVDLASTRPMSFGTSGSVVNSKAGRAFSATGTANLGRVVFGTDTGADKPGAGDFTVAIWFRLSSIATGYAAIGRWNTGATPSTSDWYLGAAGTFGGTTIDFTVAVGSSTYTASYSPSGWATGYDYVLVGRRRGTTIYVDRVTVIDGSIVSASTTNAGITTINSNSARALKLGEIDAGAIYNAELTADYVALFPRCISDAELRALWQNPSQLFESLDGWAPASAGGGISGTLTATLGALTSSATGTVAIKGTLTKTLGTLTTSATGAVAVKADLAKTLGALTLVAEASITSGRTGTLTQTLGSLTSSATGTVALTGTLGSTLGALTLAATATNDSPVIVVPQKTGAGRPSRRKSKFTVEIDGVEYAVSGEEHARELIQKAKVEAEKTAELAMKRAVMAPKRAPTKVVADARKALVLPEIVAPGLESVVAEVMNSIRDRYQSTLQAIEIAALMRRKEQEDDDEDVLLLLL